MKISSQLKKQRVHSKDLIFEILESGDIFRIFYKDYQLNLLKGNLLDGQVSNIYLRVKDNKEYQIFPLIGLRAKSAFEVRGNQVIYQGMVLDTTYQVTLTVLEDRWYYDVWINQSSTFRKFDLVYGQDVGIAHFGSIQSSEAYTAQYIDHAVYEDENGFKIQSRQNQGDPQFLQIGSLNKVTGFATDGFQVFGRSFKVDYVMEGLKKDLENRKYQYEFPYITLQSETLDGSTENTFTFYGYYEPKREEILRELLKINHTHQPIKRYQEVELKEFEPLNLEIIKVLELDKKFIDKKYPNQRHIEKHNGKLLSFFTDNHTHVVTIDKERLVERQHGHLLISGDLLSGKENTFASTNWMFGVFSSHVVLGNTNIQKLSGDLRNPLNLHKLAGLRIFIKENDKFKLFATPNVYEMGINYARWIYNYQGDIITVTASLKLNEWVHRLTIESELNKPYDFVITNQLVFGDHEYQRDFNVKIDKNSASLEAKDNNDFVASKYPNLKYRFKTQEGVIISDDSVLFNEPKGHGLISFTFNKQSKVTLDIEATYDEFKAYDLNLEKDLLEYKDFIESLTGYKFNHKKHKEELLQLEDTIFWYTHNALVHFASPHGLEQSNGAAWGTRDVLQGPVELFMTAQRFDLVRMIILRVFSRQFIENYDFPQWFMFDKYYEIQAHESHGDIIVWPLKVLGDYLEATNDFSILDEKVPFMSMKENKWVLEDSTLRTHVDKTLNAIQNSFVKGMSLPAYGGGDWDDTLQPANKKLTDHMVSGWTPVLLYESLNKLSKVLEATPLGYRVNDLKERIKNDYEKYMIVDGVPAGFIVVEDDHIDYLLHPKDKNTGLKLRLLPLTRTIISEMVDKVQAIKHVRLIDEYLKHPDGVRLMDTFVSYRGGEKTYFQRAETASNVGREIGILYVHAHIRYIEAMAKLGYNNEVYRAVFTINPINIQKYVKNAQLRQANTYFSSSDAAFYDRYEAKENFDLVKKGKVDAKAGWRLYSSGPGIYINQLVRNVMGIRITHEGIIFDPVIPDHLKGLQISFKYKNKNIHVTYNQKEIIQKVHINGNTFDDYVVRLEPNAYRTSGVKIYETLFNNLEENVYIELK